MYGVLLWFVVFAGEFFRNLCLFGCFGIFRDFGVLRFSGYFVLFGVFSGFRGVWVGIIQIFGVCVYMW